VKLQTILKRIDLPIEWIGKAVSWFILPLSLIMLGDITIREIRGYPTIWAWETAYMLCGSLFMLSAAYILRIGGHIRIDFLHERFSPRAKAIIELIFYIVIFFPLIAIGVKYGIDFAEWSWSIRELAPSPSSWNQPLYPFKTVLPLAFLLLGIQGVAEFVRNLMFVVRGTGK